VNPFGQVPEGLRRPRFSIPRNFTGVHIQCADVQRSVIAGLSKRVEALRRGDIGINKDDLPGASRFCRLEDISAGKGMVYARFDCNLTHLRFVDYGDPSLKKPGFKTFYGV
jgi:hypothetical protein